ncbi:hypothetical protein CDAR_570871 [Caerostris darwini]|uniref:Uncharacterized protein n=1 Tax=Caerostris darwini TaxID=1538125 RepID=A0AAV4QG90_9ARAC|nr:hypothetical protein CDAR_570871 [Caerostris darwini]
MKDGQQQPVPSLLKKKTHIVRIRKRRRCEDVVVFLVKSQAVRTIDHGQNQQHRAISEETSHCLLPVPSLRIHGAPSLIPKTKTKKKKKKKKRMRRTLLLGDPSQHGSWSLLVP